MMKKMKYLLHYRIHIRPIQVIFLGFGLLILFGTLLLNLPFASQNGRSIGFINAMFTATSATCVTGLIVADTATQWTIFGKCVILLLIQIGGLGFMTLATLFSLVLRRTITLKERLLIAEALNYEQMQGIVRLAKHLLAGTFMIEGIGAVILSLCFIPDFGIASGIGRGIFQSISSFCNAGFDLMGSRTPFSSMTLYAGNWIANLTIMMLIIIGGLGFVVWDDVLMNRRWSKLSPHSKLVLIISAILIVSGAALFFIFENNNPKTLQHATISERILTPLFQSVSARTAGYNSLRLADMTQASLFVLILLMFVGGSPGSTAGGIKTTTLGVILLSAFALIRGSESVNLYERRLPRYTVMKALVIVVIAFIIVVTGTMVLLVFEDFDFLSIVFEVISAFGTVGLTLGITTELSAASKCVLMCIMYAGRIGVLSTALAILARRNSGGSPIKYPEGKIMVG